MTFRRVGKDEFEARRRWTGWLSRHADLVAATNLPQDVLASENRFRYFLDNSYNYPAWRESPTYPWFSVDHLGRDHRQALWMLIQRVLQDFDDEPGRDGRLEDLRRAYGPGTW